MLVLKGNDLYQVNGKNTSLIFPVGDKLLTCVIILTYLINIYWVPTMCWEVEIGNEQRNTPISWAIIQKLKGESFAIEINSCILWLRRQESTKENRMEWCRRPHDIPGFSMSSLCSTHENPTRPLKLAKMSPNLCGTLSMSSHSLPCSSDHSGSNVP